MSKKTRTELELLAFIIVTGIIMQLVLVAVVTL